MTEAMHYVKLQGDKVECRLCPHGCVITAGRRGICRVRENRDGKLVALNYGRCSSMALDPIEKKPLYHFYPGSSILSVGTMGCNFRCEFCQNWQIAQGEPETVELAPADLVEKTLTTESIGIAYTYSEPLVWYEFVLETAQLARAAGLKNVIVTNGFIQQEALCQLLPWTDAWNIDIKGLNQEFYRKTVRGSYQPVLETVLQVSRAGCHVEITTLLVTGLNDNPDELLELFRWIAAGPGIDTPLHLSRYYPRYRLQAPATPIETMLQAWDTARRYLRYVYLGNISHPKAANTYCPYCNKMVISRSGYYVDPGGLVGKTCRFCGQELAVVRD